MPTPSLRIPPPRERSAKTEPLHRLECSTFVLAVASSSLHPAQARVHSGESPEVAHGRPEGWVQAAVDIVQPLIDGGGRRVRGRGRDGGGGGLSGGPPR